VAFYHSPGAAGTVVNNLCALGIGRVYAVGAIGDDGQGYELLQDLDSLGVDCEHLVQSKTMFTPTYTKPMKIEGDSKVEQERLDIKNRRELLPGVEEAILGGLHDVIAKVDGLIIADQVEERNFGVITDRVRDSLIDIAHGNPEKVFFADSRARIGEFRSIYLKPNKFEAYRAIHGDSTRDVSRVEAEECGRELSARSGRPVIVTLQEEGAMVCEPDGPIHIPGVRVKGEIDPVGAGDSFTAGFVSARCTGTTDVEAAYMGVLVSSITIQRIGTTGTASPDEVRQRNRELGSENG
jgi:sugar/nucleoside kinase (ribokinase family)